MRRAFPERGAFSLVEALVAAVLAGLVLVGAWWMFLSGSRQSAKLDTRLHRVQAVLELLEHLADDTAQAVHVPREGKEGNGVDAPQLKLYRFKQYSLAAASAGASVQTSGAVWTEPVLYKFDAATGKVSRNGRVLPTGQFGAVKFHPPDNLVPGVRVKVTVAAEAGEPGGAKQYEFLLPLQSASAEAAFEDWEENYYDLQPLAWE